VIYNYKNKLSEQFDESLSNINSILNIMIIIILLVSCIGLFGISDLHVEKAKRNSAIMKVLGASNMQILASTSWPLIRWIVISIAIGIPLSIIAITTIGKQIDPDISVRPINIFYACSIVLIIALTTIIVQILSSVKTSTAETLRRN